MVREHYSLQRISDLTLHIYDHQLPTIGLLIHAPWAEILSCRTRDVLQHKRGLEFIVIKRLEKKNV